MPRSCRTAVVALSAAAAILVSACGSVGSSPHRASAHAPHGTVTFAQLPGDTPLEIFPMINVSGSDYYNMGWFEEQLWSPLYWFGVGTGTGFNSAMSIARPPVWSLTRQGHTVATITLKPYRWSDGRPVTTRDVAFWMNLLKANKVQWTYYTPGYFPDNVTRVRYLSSSQFQVIFNARYSQAWLWRNELSQITPIPQHAWDKPSVSAPVANYDTTPAGAVRVYRFLFAQSSLHTTYTSNPLWKVTDGPWKLSAYNPATYYVGLVPNPTYSGPDKPRIAHFDEVPFTNSTAEFNALESGQLDFGYVPLADVNSIASIRSRGYQIRPWPLPAWGGLLPSYARDNPATPVLSQLYVRQALAHLIPVEAIIHHILHGFGQFAPGEVPNLGSGNPLVTPRYLRTPYPFDRSAATALLRSHGWTVRPGGTSTCARPGAGTGECGPGVRAGSQLSFRLLAQSGDPSLTAMWEAIQSAWSAIGVHLIVRQNTGEVALTEWYACTNQPRCPIDLFFQPQYWSLAGPYYYPTGEEAFNCQSEGNQQNWCSAETNHLTLRTDTVSNVSALHQWETYSAQQQIFLATPIPDLEIAAIRSTLHGVVPLDPYYNIYPNQWSLTK